MGSIHRFNTKKPDAAFDFGFEESGDFLPEQPKQKEETKYPAALDWDAILNTSPKPFDFVLPGLLAGTVGLLFSAGGVGKSSFALQSLIQIVTGRDLLGLGDVEQGRVVYFSGEDGTVALHHRIHALINHFSISPNEKEKLKNNLLIVPTVGHSIDLLNMLDKTWLFTQLKGRRLAVMDTLTRFHSIDENSASDAKKVMAALEGMAFETGCAIVFLHHVSKSSASSGTSDLQQSARGSSVFVDNARWASFVQVMTKDEATAFGVSLENKGRYIKWNVAKQNYSAPRFDLWLERKAGGVLVAASFEPVEIKKERYGRASQTSQAGSNHAC